MRTGALLSVSAVLIVILATLPGTAASATDTPKAALVREQTALALIGFPWQELNYDIVFKAPQHGVRAMTFPREHRIEVYARPGDDAQSLAYDIAHELGHAIDATRNTPETRAEWMKARGIDPSTPWFGCSGCTDFDTPAGDFAETFALFLLGPGHFGGRIAPPPTAEEIPALASFFPTENSYLQRPGYVSPVPVSPSLASGTGGRPRTDVQPVPEIKNPKSINPADRGDG